MKILLPLLVAFMLVRGTSRAAGGSDFQQSGGQSAASQSGNSGGGSDFQQSGSGSRGNDFGGNDFDRTNQTVHLDQSGGSNRGAVAGGAAQKEAPVVDAKKANGDDGARGGGESDAGMSLDDARVNFETIVQAYVAKKTSRGYWLYKDKSGKTWRLKGLSVDSSGIQKEEGNRYAGVGTSREARTGRRMAFDFVVDFSGDWKVVSAKPRTSKAAPQKTAPEPAADDGGNQ